jgi:hypothetical protein
MVWLRDLPNVPGATAAGDGDCITFAIAPFPGLVGDPTGRGWFVMAGALVQSLLVMLAAIEGLMTTFVVTSRLGTESFAVPTPCAFQAGFVLGRVAWTADERSVGNVADVVVGVGCGETVGTGLRSKGLTSGASEELAVVVKSVEAGLNPEGWASETASAESWGTVRSAAWGVDLDDAPFVSPMVALVAPAPGISFACGAPSLAPAPSGFAASRSSAREDGSSARACSAPASPVMASRTLGSRARGAVVGTANMLRGSATTPTIATPTNAQAPAISFQSREIRLTTSTIGRARGLTGFATCAASASFTSDASTAASNASTSTVCGALASSRDGNDGDSTLTSEVRAGAKLVLLTSVCGASASVNLRSNSSRKSGRDP